MKFTFCTDKLPEDKIVIALLHDYSEFHWPFEAIVNFGEVLYHKLDNGMTEIHVECGIPLHRKRIAVLNRNKEVCDVDFNCAWCLASEFPRPQYQIPKAPEKE